MKKLLLAIAASWLVFASPALAANVNIDGLPAATSAVGGDLYECEQAGNVNHKCTGTQIAAFLYGLMSGDATASGTGALTFATVNANVGSFGSATQCTVITVNAKGLITAASQVTCTPAMSSVTGRAALSQLPQGIANSIWINPTGSTADMQNVAVPACANDGAHALVYVNGTGLQCASITGGGGGAVSSVTGTIGITVSPTTGAVVVSSSVTQRNNTATTDTLLSTDSGTVVTESNASAVAVGIAVASTTGFTSGNYWTLKNKGAGLVTITPTTSTIDGNATLTVKQNQSVDFYSDGANYFTLPGRPTNVAASDLSGLGTGVATALGVNVGTAGSPVVNGGALGTPSSGTGTNLTGVPISTGVSGLGTGVATAAAVALSGAGGLTSTIASGTAVLGTSAIGSGACATVVTVTATNVATTDVVSFGYNSDPTAVTGYGASATGAVLTIYPYPSSGNVNVKVCNSSSGSITPSAMTLNWRAWR